ncbi:SUMF1/EgtB/PvdO family nonheme iron enzyme [Planctomycetota bacterium]
MLTKVSFWKHGRGEPSMLEPNTIPGYVLLNEIGRGGQGTVYAARTSDALGHSVAIKCFPPDDRGAYLHELDVCRAIEEARRHTACEHLVEGLAADVLEDGTAYVVMPYFHRGSLASLVRRKGACDEPTAVSFVVQALAALDTLHAAELYHRDVKPSNLLLVDDGRVCLSDFGLARNFREPSSLAGSPGFIAPELLAGAAASASGVSVDVYAAGATLHFLLTGRISPTGVDLFELERAGVSRPLQAVLIKALHKKPAQRYLSASATREALERTLREAPAGDSDKQADVAGDTTRRVKKLFAVATVAVLLALVLVLVSDPNQDDPDSSSGGAVSSAPQSAEDDHENDPATRSSQSESDTTALVQRQPGAGSALSTKQANTAGDATRSVAGARRGGRLDDVRPPRASVLSPVFGSVASGTMVRVRGTVVDESIQLVTISCVDSAEEKPQEIALRTGSPPGSVDAAVSSFSTLVPLEREGENRFVLVARDAAGNETGCGIAVVRDATAPTVQITSPLPGMITNERIVAVEGTVSDDRLMRATFAGKGLRTIGGRFSAQWKLSEGKNEATLSAVDAAGNESHEVVRAALDSTPPTITVESTQVAGSEKVSAGTATVIVTADEPLSEIQIGERRVPGDERTTVTSVVFVPKGGATYTVRAFDVAGNATSRELKIARDRHKRGRRGWHGEPIPTGLRRGLIRNLYRWNTGRGFDVEMVYVPLKQPPIEGNRRERTRVHKSPRDPAEVSEGFWIARTETTWAFFSRFCRARNLPQPQMPTWKPTPDHPVVNVSWKQAVGYCEWVGLSLPKESLWEKAARPAVGGRFPWGDLWGGTARANYCDRLAASDMFWKDRDLDDGFPHTAPVGSFPGGASACRALDMAGNIAEWCVDIYVLEETSVGRSSAGEASRAEAPHVYRGGSWLSEREGLQTSSRGGSDIAHESIGFRPVLLPVSGPSDRSAGNALGNGPSSPPGALR